MTTFKLPEPVAALLRRIDAYLHGDSSEATRIIKDTPGAIIAAYEAGKAERSDIEDVDTKDLLDDLASCFQSEHRNPNMSDRTREMIRAAYYHILSVEIGNG
jgi:hypothetical protein